MTVLDIRQLTVVYHTEQGDVAALDGVDLSIGEGEIVGLVGESGCGKTTMGKTILGILPRPAGEILSGSIHFKGEDLLALSHKEMNDRVRGRAITLVPQDPFVSFNPVFTIGTQFLDILRHKSAPGARGRSSSKDAKNTVIEFLRQVQVPSAETVIYKFPHEMSGGQRQRTMIAMALAPRPALVIADEPTTALDATIGAQVLELLRGLTKQFQTSVLFITHDLGVAYAICDRIIVMYAGQIMELGGTESLFKRPCHPYTRALLASLPNPRGEIETIPGDIPNLVHPPEGCRFHPRCRFAGERCSEETPEKKQREPGHVVHCFNPQ
jgi:peptide/nickel transport system ATP-binding protein